MPTQLSLKDIKRWLLLSNEQLKLHKRIAEIQKELREIMKGYDFG